MKNPPNRLGFAAGLAALLLIVSAPLAFATGSDESTPEPSPDLCVVEPERTELVEHEAETVREQRWSRDVPATTRTEYRYSKPVKGTDGIRECKWKSKVTDYKTKFQYQKQVKGLTQKQVKKPYGGTKWEDTGTFDWEWFTSPSYKWSYKDKDVLESGGHNSTQAEWTDNGVKYRKITQQYRYVKNGETQQVENGSHWEYQWASESPGKDWTKTDECRWKVEPTPDTTEYSEWTIELLTDPWTLSEQREVPDTEGFTEYYVPGAEPSRDLGEQNWTEDSPAKWSFVDERTRVTKEAWTEEITIPAVYGPCPTPSETPTPEPTPTPTPEPTPEPTPSETPTPTPTPSETPTPEPTPTPTPTPEPRLAETGADVEILGTLSVIGLTLVTLGTILRRRSLR